MIDWIPNDGPQTDFLSRGEFEVLYGGAAGGGKSDALVADATRYIHHPDYNAIILRRTFPQLQEIIDRCYLIYPRLGGVYRSTEHRWYFPSGAKINLGHMQHETDKYNYQGKEYQFIGFDELTQFLESQYLYLMSRCRSANPNIRKRMRSTTNPGGIGNYWVKSRFIDVCKPATTFIDPVTGLSRAFVPALVFDNPYIAENDPDYVKRLQGLPKAERKRLLDGDWSIFEGQVFGELTHAVHGCEPFEIPPDWEIFCVLDWGYSKPFCVFWFAMDYDGVMYLWREYYGCKDGEPDTGLRMTAHDVGMKILEIEKYDSKPPRLRFADPAIFSKTAGISQRRRETVGGSVHEDMQRLGIHWLKADNDRLQGWQQCHKRLSVDEEVNEDTGEVLKIPKFYAFNNCYAFWRTVPTLVQDKRNTEDVDTDSEDHAGDTFRYGCMSRPVKAKKVYNGPAAGSFRHTRNKLSKAREYASRHGVSLDEAYRRVK